MQVSELEKNLKLHQLRLKEVEHSLETERALSSKLYDDVRVAHSKRNPLFDIRRSTQLSLRVCVQRAVREYLRQQLDL